MANNIEKQLKEISERLEQGVKEIFTSERYTVDTPGLSALLLCDIVTQSGNGIKMIWKQRHER